MDTQDFDSFSLAQERFEKAEDRTIRDAGYGSTKAALSIIEKHITTTTQVIQEKLEVTNRPSMNEIALDLRLLKPELLALVALQGAMDCIGQEDDLSKTFHKLGAMVEKELYAQSLIGFDKKTAGRLEDRAKRRGGSVKYRRQAVSKMAKDKGFKAARWSKDTKGRVGQWLVEVLTELDDVFVIVRDREEQGDRSFITLTHEALDYSQAFVARLIQSRPVALPLLTAPPPWTGYTLPLESAGRAYNVPLVRKATKVQKAHIKQAISEGRMDRVLRGLTYAGSTTWAINPRVLEVVQQAYELGIEIEGMPQKNDLEIGEKLAPETWEAMTEEEKRVHKIDIGEKLGKNRSLVGERSIYDQDIATAKYLIDNGNHFYTPMNLDYRGRVYGIAYFSYQRQDYVRGMFQYANGKPLSDDGLYWLMVHLANCGDFDKVSKDTFEARVHWVQTHSDRIVSMAERPLDDIWWSKADAPFCFLAAAMAYAEALKNPEFICHVPLGFDGTCSGLQHLAAMTRCEQTAPLVNLTPNVIPADVYRTVAEALEDKVFYAAAKNTEDSLVFRRALDYGIDRSLVKRNVMTYTYGSKKYGMTQQLMEDTMRPLQLKVVKKKIASHPFLVPQDTYEADDGRVVTNPGRTAAKLLGPMTFDTIEDVVKRPAEAMRFLQKISKALSHEGKPTVWHTPLGMPVVLHYPNMKSNRVILWMHDRGVRVQARMTTAEEQAGIDKVATANAVAPCFVHSFDATHLQMVALEAAQQDILDLALVHDSFGCHACDASRFRRVITGTFYDLYSKHDVLGNFLREAHAQIQTNHLRLPERSEVTTGSYDLNNIKESLYAFA